MKYLYVGTTPEIRTGDQRQAVAAMRSSLEREFALPTREIGLPAVDFAHDGARGQYASTAVLEMLIRDLPADALKLLGVTGRDLFIPVLTFVFGQAQLGGQVGVVSLARLQQEFYGLPAARDTLMDRAAKEALHEAGHLFHLVHCADSRCAMSLSTGVRQIDRKDAAFCAGCRGRLAARAGHPFPGPDVPREVNL
jgi:archaemetzincin